MLLEHSEADYAPRTEANVADADGTLIVGDAGSGGSRETKEFSGKHEKLCYVLPWRSGQPIPRNAASDFRHWLAEHKIRVLNVAGDRESKEPGIGDAVLAFLMASLAG